MTDTETTKTKKASEPVLVLCSSPVTLLIPSGAQRLTAAGRVPSYVGLRFERGPNVLAGRCLVRVRDGEATTTKPLYIELDQLPAAIAGLPEGEREAAILGALDKYKADHREHAHLFEKRGEVQPAFVARGTVQELMQKHYVQLREAAERGTHRLSLEALLAHPHVDESIRSLITIRLSAWRQEEAA